MFQIKFYKRYDNGDTKLFYVKEYGNFEEAFLYYATNKNKFRENRIFITLKSE